MPLARPASQTPLTNPSNPPAPYRRLVSQRFAAVLVVARVLAAVALLAGLVGSLTAVAAAQTPSEAPSATPSTTAPNTPADTGQAGREDSQGAAEPPQEADAGDRDAGDAASLKVTPTEGLSDRIQNVFGTAVNAMARVLFYRVFAGEREYLDFAEVTYYRPAAETDAPYRRLTPNTAAPETLTDAEVAQQTALKRLSQNPSPGTLAGSGEEVLFFKLRLGNGKYVRDDDGQFHRLLEPVDRMQLSQTDVLSGDEARQLHDEGKLKSGGPDASPYVLTESVGGAPLVVLWLALGAVFFTIYMKGYNLWGFRHALDIVRGKYDNPDEPGEVTHFQALASALSATVGLGNIAGVTIAMTMGGPGAFFWMMACGAFGMTSKFVECTLGQKYRSVKPDGTVLGGPMQYLHKGLAELGLGPLGFVMSIAFAVMCVMASFGGGNMFQANQSGLQLMSVLQRQDIETLQEIRVELRETDPGDKQKLVELHQQQQALAAKIEGFRTWFRPVYGVILAVMVGVVIIGGIRRIGAAAEKVVPTMCLVYLAACTWIIGTHIAQVPAMLGQIVLQAFRPEAFGGGLLGVLVIGVQRAAFSNEAGVGSAAIAHSAAKTEEPVREGTVALLGPFIDTIVVCSMTALVILITGAWENNEWVVDMGLEGAELTTKAFGSEIPWFPYLLAVAVVLFAYSTLISWSYYGERCWERLFGPRSTMFYKLLYVLAALLGAMVNLGAVLDFSDMMILSMAFPNVLGLILLSPKVRRDLFDYWKRYRSGQFKTFR